MKGIDHVFGLTPRDVCSARSRGQGRRLDVEGSRTSADGPDVVR